MFSYEILLEYDCILLGDLCVPMYLLFWLVSYRPMVINTIQTWITVSHSDCSYDLQTCMSNHIQTLYLIITFIVKIKLFLHRQ